jgi:hypothetical protein
MQRIGRIRAKVVVGSVALTLCWSALIDQRGVAQGVTATIGGRVSRGTDAVAGATVIVLRREYRGGNGFAWARVPLSSANSDARGLYRIAGLAPGNYLVAVLDAGQSVLRRVSLPTFAPYSHVASAATMFTLAAGTKELGADVQLDTNETLSSIRGRVVNGQQAVPGLTVRLRRVNVGEERTTDLDEITNATDSSGTFRFSGLPLGAYKLRMVQFPASEPRFRTSRECRTTQSRPESFDAGCV